MTAAVNSSTIVIKEDRYFIGFWTFAFACVACDTDQEEMCDDWLGVLWRDPGGPWILQFRFRHGDDKAWSRFVVPDGLDDASAEKLVHEAAEKMRDHVALEKRCSEMESTPMRSSSVEKNTRVLCDHKWAHVIPTQRGGSA